MLLIEKADGVATVTMNRPEAMNAMSKALRAELDKAFTALDTDDEVRAVVLTGAGERAFTAGLDLKELGAEGVGAANATEPAANPVRAIQQCGKPVIGAINGVAITGGFELALNCDFLVASERAKFGDTHSRVGVMPGWGLTVLLPQAIGVRRAREMSFTGNFLSAEEAYQWGLVNHVVAHDQLLPTCRQLATDIIGNDQPGVRQIRRTYAAINAERDGWRIEANDSVEWRRTMFTPEKVAARRDAIIARGRTQ
jgi:enoyl-CoA hydratase